MGILDQELAKFAQSDRFKKLSNNYLNSSGFKSSKKGTLTLAKNAEEYKDRMIEILTEEMYLYGLSEYAGFVSVIQDTDETLINGAPCVKISIEFDADVAYSPSLLPSKYIGVILPRLLNTGYRAKRTVRGIWHSKSQGVTYENHISLQSRAALNFIESAVAIFNKEFRGFAIAEYISQPA